MNSVKMIVKSTLVAAAAAVLLTGCGGDAPAPASSQAAAPAPASSQQAQNPDKSGEMNLGDGLDADGRGDPVFEDVLGEWLYQGQGCIMTFDERGDVLIEYEGTPYHCTFMVEDGQIIITAPDGTTATAVFGMDGMLFFEGSSTGFMRSSSWGSQSMPEDGPGTGANYDEPYEPPEFTASVEDYLGTWLCDGDYCVISVMEDGTFVLEDQGGTMKGGTLWHEDGWLELLADEGAWIRMDVTGYGEAVTDAYDGTFYLE